MRGLAAIILLSVISVGAVSVLARPSSAAESSPCQFQKADLPLKIAFCETFDAPAGDPATRAGDLDPILWGVSRIGDAINTTQGQFNEFAPARLEGCGGTITVTPPGDVRICGGRLFEAVNDNGGQTGLAIYPKQPFDVAGRTGTAVFDVSADAAGPHGAWPEFWWTDQPVPAPTTPIAAQTPSARNAFGFSIAAGCNGNATGIDRMFVSRNYVFEEVSFAGDSCAITKGTAIGNLNHFEVRISASHVEVYGTDAGSTNLKLLASASVSMPLTRGLIWGVDVHYNAEKFDGQGNHTFAWDNMGFDGPTPYRDLSFDVQDSHSPKPNSLGWGVPFSVVARGVYWDQVPTGALVVFNWWPQSEAVPDVRVNGGPWRSTSWIGGEAFAWRTIGVSIPVSEVRAGANTIEMRSADGATLVSNINLVLIAATPVPGSQASAGSFAGAVPGRGGTALLVTAQSVQTPGLVGALGTQGCAVGALGVLAGGQWSLFLPGAPAAVNRGFPASLAASTPFFVRCG